MSQVNGGWYEICDLCDNGMNFKILTAGMHKE